MFKFAIKKFMVIFSLLLVSLTATYAWFYTGDTFTNDNIQMKFNMSNYLTISTDNINYSEILSLSFDSTNLKPITSDGTKFYTPIVESLTENKGNVQVYQKTVTEYQEYDIFKTDSRVAATYIYIKSDIATNLMFNTLCSVTPKSLSDRLVDYNLIDENEKFTKDYIASAIRISLIRYDNNSYSTCAVWAPNSEYELTKSNNLYSFSEEGNVESNYKLVEEYRDDEGVKHQLISIDTDGEASGIVKTKNISYIWGDITEIDNPDYVLADLHAGINKFILAVWLDGNDRECEPCLTGGLFNVNLFFTGVYGINMKNDDEEE